MRWMTGSNRRGWVVALALVVVALGGVGPVSGAGAQGPHASDSSHRAAPTKAARARYRQAITLGLQEFKLGNFEEARARFAEAHEAFPNARTLRGLGMVEYELRHYLAAADHLQNALASTVRPLDSRMQTEVRTLLDQARRYLARLTFEFTPRDATLRVDGHAVAVDAPLTVEVGDHTLQAEAEGHYPLRQHVSIVGGEERHLKLALTPLPATAAQALSDPAIAPASAGRQDGDDRDRDTPLYGKWWVWTIAGTVVAGAVIATLLATQGGDQLSAEPATTIEEIGTVQL